jgi:RNA polymerase sigma-70 factor (sigma-E family)
LFLFAVVLCSDPVAAEDLVQDVLGRAFERWAQVSAADKVNAYVRRMVVNEYLSRRRRSRLVPREDIGELLAADPDPAGEYVEREAMLADLARLPRRQRAVLVLSYYEGLADTEIAEVLHCRRGTVRSLASRALAALRIDMGDRTMPAVRAGTTSRPADAGATPKED